MVVDRIFSFFFCLVYPPFDFSIHHHSLFTFIFHRRFLIHFILFLFILSLPISSFTCRNTQQKQHSPFSSKQLGILLTPLLSSTLSSLNCFRTRIPSPCVPCTLTSNCTHTPLSSGQLPHLLHLSFFNINLS